jgi:GGDEF domain-containing protein
MAGKEKTATKNPNRKSIKVGSSSKESNTESLKNGLNYPETVSPDCFCVQGESIQATCLDQNSGLYHPQHFQLSLSYEFNRMERTEKPLGLIILRLCKAEVSDFRKLAAFLKSALKPLDLAARLNDEEVAVLIPEADRDRAVRLIEVLGQEYATAGKLCGPRVVFGAALARPYQGGKPDELVQKARENVGPANEVAQKVISGSSPWAEVETALAGPERDSLFNGFGSLALSPGRRS